MARDLEKVIGKDIRQATRYAEGKSNDVSNLQADIQGLEADLEALHKKYQEDQAKLLEKRKPLLVKLETATQEASEAWEYVEHLKSVNE